MKILVFIPAYNCEKQLIRVLNKVQEYKEFDFDEVVIINNQSTDGTLLAAINYKKENHFSKLKIVSNNINIGLGGSHKMAFQYAIDNNFDGCLILHGDDQGDIGNTPVALFENGNCLFGSRFKLDSRLINYSRFRITGNIVFNLLSSFICLKRISDFGGSGLNYFPTKVLRQHSFWDYSNDLTFHAYLILNIIKKNHNIIFFPITWREDDQISNVKLLKQTIKYLKILVQYPFNKKLIDIECSLRNKEAHWIIHE